MTLSTTHRWRVGRWVPMLLASLLFGACQMESQRNDNNAPLPGRRVPAGQVAIGDVLWYADYDAALAAAGAANLPLWAHFGEDPG